jgi:hypothetical protein
MRCAAYRVELHQGVPGRQVCRVPPSSSSSSRCQLSSSQLVFSGASHLSQSRHQLACMQDGKDELRQVEYRCMER